MSNLESAEKSLDQTKEHLTSLKQAISLSLGKNVGKVLQDSYVRDLLKHLESVETLGYNQRHYEDAVKRLKESDTLLVLDKEVEKIITPDDLSVGDKFDLRVDIESYISYTLVELDHDTKKLLLWDGSRDSKGVKKVTNYYNVFCESLSNDEDISNVIKNYVKVL